MRTSKVAHAYEYPKGDLVARFSAEQQELAAKISNDIAEEIDCGETRMELRMAVAFYADLACLRAQELESIRNRVLGLGLELADERLKGLANRKTTAPGGMEERE